MTRDFSTLLTSRFCHDMANPLGAIGNGLELLELSGQANSPEMMLIQDSVTQAKAKLALFRLAFGHIVRLEEQRSENTAKLVQIWTEASRVKLSHDPVLAITEPDMKILALCLMCFENAMPLGGDVVLTQDARGLALNGTGRRIKFDPDLWDHVTEDVAPSTEVEAARLHFLALRLEARTQCTTIDCQAGEDQIKLTLTPD